MAIPNLGDVLTYDGSAWVNQPWVQGPFGISTSTPGAQIDVGVVAPGLNMPANYFIGYGANTGWPLNLAAIYDASYVDQYILLNGKLSGTRAAPTATGSNGGGSFIRHGCGISTTMRLQFGMYDSGSAQTLNTYMTILGTGNVGIGTLSPGSLLDVSGDINIGGSGSLFLPNSQSSGYGIIAIQSTRGFQVLSGTTQLLQIDTSFNFNLGGNGGTVTLASTGDGNLVLRGGDVGPGRTAVIQFYTSNPSLAERMRITDTGKVGIGTTSPTALLHLPAGTASANTAPLKFASGTNLTTPEAGAVEFDGTRWFGTPVTTRRAVQLSSDHLTTAVRVVNTTTATTVFTGTINSNEWAVGKTFKARIFGYYSTFDSLSSFTIEMQVGGTTILSQGSPPAQVTNTCFDMEFVFTCTAVGTSGDLIASCTGEINKVVRAEAATASTALNTGVQQNVTFQIVWSTANTGNDLWVTQGYLEMLN